MSPASSSTAEPGSSSPEAPTVSAWYLHRTGATPGGAEHHRHLGGRVSGGEVGCSRWLMARRTSTSLTATTDGAGRSGQCGLMMSASRAVAPRTMRVGCRRRAAASRPPRPRRRQRPRRGCSGRRRASCERADQRRRSRRGAAPRTARPRRGAGRRPDGVGPGQLGAVAELVVDGLAAHAGARATWAIVTARQLVPRQLVGACSTVSRSSAREASAKRRSASGSVGAHAAARRARSRARMRGWMLARVTSPRRTRRPGGPSPGATPAG